MIDTHTHLYDEAFDEDFDDVLRRASDAGVEILSGLEVYSGRSVYNAFT